jgi:hypothetical protein
MNSVGKNVKSISVVERLGSQELVEVLSTTHRLAVVDVGIRLDNPQELLAWVVEVELNLVGRRTNRFITSELELLNQILMRILGHTSALISVEENVIDVERSSNNRLVESGGSLNLLVVSFLIKLAYSPQALINRAEINVDLYLVVLKGNEGNSKTRVAAEPELKWYVKSGFRKGLARGTDLVRGTINGTRSVNSIEVWVSDVSELSSVTNHLVVATGLLRSEGELVPNVHPITILAVDALTSDFNLNLLDKLLTRAVEPAGITSVFRRNLG